MERQTLEHQPLPPAPREPGEQPPALPEGAFSRLEKLAGTEGALRLSQARVAVFGLGAVGSFAVEALARSGVGFLRLVDFDRIQASNLNRQIFALTSTIGLPKVEVAAQRVQQINPTIQLDLHERFFCQETADLLLGGSPTHGNHEAQTDIPLDFVIDAIDSLNPKVTLLREAVNRSLPVVSSMGAANRTDSTKLHIGDIAQSWGCPLARKVRNRLRRQGIDHGITAVWSSEPPAVPPGSPGDADALEEHDMSHRGRMRGIQPSMACIPGMFGLTAANIVIWNIIGRR